MGFLNHKPGDKLPWIGYGSLGVFLMLLSTFIVLFFRSTTTNVINSGAISQLPNGTIRLDTHSSRFILRNCIPTLEITSSEDDPFRLIYFNWSEIYWKLAANIKQATPKELLKNQIPLLAIVKPKPLPIVMAKKTIPEPKVPETEEVEEISPLLSTEPQVLIYHTHTTESFIPVSGKDHQNNKKGDIVKVGAHLQKILEERYGIKCVHSEEIHDTYPFRDSYVRSQATVKQYLAKYPSIQVVLDVHRDATPGVKAVCDVKGEKTATVLFVVGTNKMGLPHPNWKVNEQFATDLSQIMNTYYPGLNNGGIIVSKARYNQHLHPHSIIVEIGDQNSTMEEACRAAELFAGVLAAKMKNNYEAVNQ